MESADPCLAAPRLTVDTFVLRPWRPEDLNPVLRGCGDPEIVRWTSMPAAEPELVQHWLDQRVPQAQAGQSLFTAIVDQRDQVLGSMGCLAFDWQHARGEIGYWLLPEARGRGIAELGLKVFSRWALEDLPLQRLDLFVNPPNISSQRVALRAGYRYEGRLRSFRIYDGRRTTLDLYALLAEDIGLAS